MNLLDRIKREAILEGAAVYFDAVNGVAGTAHPVGTAEMPVNNMADLRAILAARNLRTVVVMSDMTWDADMVGYHFIGKEILKYVVDTNGFNPDVSTFERVNVDISLAPVGVDYEIYAIDCEVDGEINRLYAYRCNLSIELVGGASAYSEVHTYGCWGGNYIDFNSVDESEVIFTGSACALDITNMNDADHEAEVFICNGILTTDGFCTAGRLRIYGHCEFGDAGAGTKICDYRIGQQNTRFFQEAVAATDVNGTTWEDLLDRSTIDRPVRICGFRVTVAGGWAGNAQIRIVDGASTTKIFPFQDEYVEGTDFASGTQVAFNFPVEVSALKGYKFQFRSSNAADGAGKTLQLNNLDVQELS